jgi:putative transposase
LERTPKLEPGKLYHIYNRGNNRENIFFEERNYAYFLTLYEKDILHVADIYAYCLMRNHFHSLVKMKEEAKPIPQVNPSQHFSNFFNSYAKSINNAYDRTGALFERPFGRIEVPSEEYFIRLILYIHLNPQKHGFVHDFESYPYSSYPILLSQDSTFLKREEIFNWFGTKEEFIRAHRSYREEKDLQQFTGNDID